MVITRLWPVIFVIALQFNYLQLFKCDCSWIWDSGSQDSPIELRDIVQPNQSWQEKACSSFPTDRFSQQKTKPKAVSRFCLTGSDSKHKEYLCYPWQAAAVLKKCLCDTSLWLSKKKQTCFLCKEVFWAISMHKIDNGFHTFEELEVGQ